MAVPHNDSKRRKAAASLVLALLAASKALMDTDVVAGAAAEVVAGAATDAVPGAAAGVATGAGSGAAADAGLGKDPGDCSAAGNGSIGETEVVAAGGVFLAMACRGEISRCHSCQPTTATPATPAKHKAPASQESHCGANRRP